MSSLPRSLPEVHASVPTGQRSGWKRLLAFSGPAYLVSVGYMDPGNWATDLEGGARFGYSLLWVLVMSNLMAILLQTLSARLGVVARLDLAQACRDHYPRTVNWMLWVLCEIAIAACDLAEVIGAAIALNLLFHLPLIAGVLLTACDTFLILWFNRLGMRVMEAFVLGLIAIIGGCFLIEILYAQPVFKDVAAGLIPSLNGKSLYVAIGILGATVMPHNLYLHSALVQTRKIGDELVDKRAALRFNLYDCLIALNGSLFVNAAILIVAGAVFYTHHKEVTQIQQAHELLSPLLGTAAASTIFAVALLCSGQSSTVTGTMAGQIVMEGFLRLRVQPWLRRFVTRSVAVIPAVATIAIAGDQSTFQLILLSQVILSLQLPFAVIPLIHLTSSRDVMGEFANSTWVRALSWTVSSIILGLNSWLVYTTVTEWTASRPWLGLPLYAMIGGLCLLLAWVLFEPLFKPAWQSRGLPPVAATVTPEKLALPTLHYRRILVPLDHSPLDSLAVAHAAALAGQHGAKLYLLHVEEGVTSQVYGSLASTAEVQAGQHYLDLHLQMLHDAGIEAEALIRHSRSPKREIVKVAREIQPDLLVMGAHGHRGLSDLIFGTTINSVRHHLGVPLLVIRA